MVTLSLIAFCLGILALGCYQLYVVVALLRVDGPTVVTMVTITVAYAMAGKAHPVVVRALRSVREFTGSRLKFLRFPGMLAMLLVVLIAATFGYEEHDQLSQIMPMLAALMIAGFVASSTERVRKVDRRGKAIE